MSPRSFEFEINMHKVFKMLLLVKKISDRDCRSMVATVRKLNFVARTS